MIDIQFIADHGRLSLQEYVVAYPFSIYKSNKITTRKIYWKIADIKCEKIKGSFKIFYARKLDISKLQTKDQEINVNGGTIKNISNTQLFTDDTAEQFILFQKNLLLYVDEKNIGVSYEYNKKNFLPFFLINNKSEIEKMVHFWLEYDDSNNKLTDEKISIILRLEYKE